MKFLLCKICFISFFVFFLLFFSLPSAHAQYFGQNKVRYKTLDFKVLKTQHFDIYYYPEEAAMAPEVGRMAERWYARLSDVFRHQLSTRQPVIMYASPPDFRSTNVIPGDLGESTGGVTEPLRRRVVMPLAGPLADTDHVLGHELVHAFQFDISLPQGAMGGGLETAGVARLPLWFVEGMAEFLSLGPIDPNTTMWMRDAVAKDKVPKIKDLNNPKYFPYRWGQSLWAYIAGRYGQKTVGELQRMAGSSGNVDAAIQTVLEITPQQLSQDWQQALRRQFGPIIEETLAPDQQGQVLISKDKNGGGSTLNVSPSVSPDGKQMVLFSAKGLFSIDLYLANAQTGKIERKLTSTAVNPHLDSLEFIQSAGAWSNDGNRFAFGEIVEGRPRLAIMNIKSGKIVSSIPLPGLGEVYTPTWSPDDKQIAFSGLVGGVTDLFVADVQTRQMRRLTQDNFADLQPVWSPDGSTIAFVTDRFGTDIDDLSYGRLQLALLNANTGDIQRLQTFPTGKSINPQWAPDGKSVYFVSDRDGIPNIYRMTVPDRQITQVTDIQTGITGITTTSPSFSVAARDGRLVYSAFLDSDYNVYAINANTNPAGSAPETALASRHADVLPPVQQNTQSPIEALIANPNNGLPQNKDFAVTNYQPKLGLDYVAPPSIGIGYSSFGTLVSGGTGLYFSDLLGERSMMVSLSSTSFGNTNAFYRNLAGVVAWQNQKSRWNWGFVGGQVPFVTAGFGAATTTTTGGQPVLVEQATTFWQLNREVAFLASYPFNRAQRIELSAGYNNIGFAANSETAIIAADGTVLSNTLQDIPTPPALNLATASAALVYDTSVFGGTSPVLGQRYRLEADQAGGSLTFSTLLADYRKYIHIARPLSIAGRALTYGRYGSGADDQRLQDIFVGYSELVHGYDPNSFSTAECGPNLAVNGSCPVFDQLIGSKIGVANAEARLELLGPLGVIPSRPVPPVELAWFYDAGAAWTSADKASFLGGDRKGVTSTGGALRFNLLGFAVGEVSYTHPYDRPLKNWIWQFNLVPGW